MDKGRQTFGFKKMKRDKMGTRIKPANMLDYQTPYLKSAHASANRGFVDWQAISVKDRQRFHVRPEVTVNSLGEIAIVVDDGSLTLRSGELDYPAVWEHIRNTYGDEFDFLTFFADFPVPFGYSFWSAIYFNTSGISPYALPFDVRSAWNTQRLQGFHFINPGHLDLMGVYLQEFGHQWGSYVYFADSQDSEFVYADLLLDGEPGHWDFLMDDGHSPMDYDFQFAPFMSTHWQQREDDLSRFDYHAIEGIEYCDLDLYLMGLLRPEDVRPFYFIANAQQVGPRTWRGERIQVTVENVINAMGPREAPAALPVNECRNAWILVTRSERQGVRMAARLDAVREEFGLRFHVATRCLGSVDTTLHRVT